MDYQHFDAKEFLVNRLRALESEHYSNYLVSITAKDKSEEKQTAVDNIAKIEKAIATCRQELEQIRASE